MTPAQRDLLIAAPERWDETCFAIPAVRALIASGLGVGVICNKSHAPLWETIDDLVIVSSDKMIAQSTSEIWKAALILEYGPLAKVIKSAKISRRLGGPDQKLLKLLTHPLEITVGPLDHRVRYYLSIAEAMGVDINNPAFFAPVVRQDTSRSDSVLLCPDSDYGSHYEWSLNRWVALAKQLIADGRKVHVAGISHQRGFGSSLANLLDQPRVELTIDTLASALPEFAKHSLVVAADGSAPHLAAHAGATCVTLFGPNDPQWKRPLGKRHGIIHRHVECAPCLLEKCPLDLRCQNELEVEQVLTAIQALVAG